MKVCAIIFLITFCLIGQAAFASDPCAEETNKIACISGLIDQEVVTINGLLAELKTPGPQGEIGDQGPEGEQGEKGDVGDDEYTDQYSELSDREAELNSSQSTWYQTLQANVISDVYPSLNTTSSLIGRLQKARGEISRYNRNPYIIAGINEYSSNESGYAYFDKLVFPQYRPTGRILTNSDYMEEEIFDLRVPNFYYEDPADNCVYLVTKSPEGFEVESGVEIELDSCLGDVDYPGSIYQKQPVCDLVPNSGFCAHLLREEEEQKLTTLFDGAEDNLELSDDDFKIDEEDLRFDDPIFDSKVPINIGSASDYANFKLGMDFDDPLYQAVLSRTLDFIEDNTDEISSIISDSEEEIMETWEILESLPQPPTELVNITNQANAVRTGFHNAKSQLTLLSQNNQYSRSILSMSGGQDDLMRYLLVVHLIDIYVEYRTGESNFTQVQIDDGILDSIEKLESNLSYFARDRKKYIKQQAYLARVAFHSNFNGMPLDSLLGAPSTPDFVSIAEDQLNTFAVLNLPAELAEFYFALESANEEGEPRLLELLPLASAAIATSTGIDPEKLIEEQANAMIMKIVDKAIKKISVKGAKVAMKALGYAGRIGSSGPAKIIALAFEIGITEGIEVFEQGAKDRRYKLIMAQDANRLIHPNDMTDVEVSSLLHDWLYLELGENVLLSNEVYVISP